MLVIAVGSSRLFSDLNVGPSEDCSKYFGLEPYLTISLLHGFLSAGGIASQCVRSFH